MLFNEVLTFESVNEILKCTYSNETELLSMQYVHVVHFSAVQGSISAI